MPAPRRPFAAYIDYAAQLEPALALVGGVYNFEIDKSDTVSLNGIAAQRPHIGCMVTHNKTPYLFLLLRLNAPVDSFESCELRIEGPARTIFWRMAGANLYPLTRKAEANAAIQNYSSAVRAELKEMQAQYNRRFTPIAPLAFFEIEEMV